MFRFQMLSLRIKAVVSLLQGRCQGSTRQYHDRDDILWKLWDAFQCPVEPYKTFFKFRCLKKLTPILGRELLPATALLMASELHQE